MESEKAAPGSPPDGDRDSRRRVVEPGGRAPAPAPAPAVNGAESNGNGRHASPGFVTARRRDRPGAARRSTGCRSRSCRSPTVRKPAVSSVSLPIRQGEVLALIGPSGCGKTTLLRSLNRLTELTRTASFSGRITPRRSRHRRHRADRAAAPRDDGVPAAEPVPDERVRQRRLRAARAGLAPAEARTRRARRGPRGARPSRAARGGRRQPRPSGAAALRRPAAAALHRPGAGGESRGAAAR